MRHGLPNGRIGGGIKAFLKAREEERRSRQAKARRAVVADKVNTDDVTSVDVDGPEVVIIAVEAEPDEVVSDSLKNGYVTYNLNDPDPISADDIITEKEVAAEIVTAKPKRKKRKYTRRKKKSTVAS